MEHVTDAPQEDTPQIVITECEDKAPELDEETWTAPSKTPKIANHQKMNVLKDMFNGHSEHLNTHAKQIKELQIAIFTLNKVLHIFRDKGLNSLEEQLLGLEKVFKTNAVKVEDRLTHLEEVLLESSDDDIQAIYGCNGVEAIHQDDKELKEEEWKLYDHPTFPEEVVDWSKRKEEKKTPIPE